MRALLLIQLVSLSICSSILREYLDAVEQFGDNSISGGSLGSSTPVNKEHFLAFKKFKEEVDFINSDDSIPFSAAINQFSIMTDSEKLLFTGLNQSMRTNDFLGSAQFIDEGSLSSNLPESFDWVELGAVNPIKQQGVCGSCWAFAAVSAIENGYFRVTSEKPIFSEQEVLSCTYEMHKGKNGCDGGWLDAPMYYVSRKDRLALQEDVPYVGSDLECRYNKAPNALTKAKVVGVKKTNGDKNLKFLITKGVVSVAVATPSSYYTYSNGIYTDPKGCTGRVAHAINVVGYGREGNRNFWRARNSWGKQWGEEGYVRYNRDITNVCKISYDVELPEMVCRNGNCNAFDNVKRCENIWMDSFCNAVSPYCRSTASVGNKLKFRDLIRKKCNKSCRVC